MEKIKIYSRQKIAGLISLRDGETKFGERIGLIEDFSGLQTHPARYVLFGIPEDIGVRANQGKAGSSNAWSLALKSLLNVQANRYTNPENLLLLGEIDCSVEAFKAGNIDEKDPNYHEKLGDLVTSIDATVSQVVHSIISAGKVPVIIGGGHNNAYGNIKGACLATGKPVNILNIDAHTDLRAPGHRHSGNGFSYARKDNFMGKYRVFGVHQNYTPSYIFERMDASENEQYRLFEHLILKSSQQILEAFREEMAMVSGEDFGLELDVDSIRGFPSSAQTPSGFPFNMIRNFIALASEEEKIKYLHICEAAPTKATEAKVGKALSYLITDFIQQKG